MLDNVSLGADCKMERIFWNLNHDLLFFALSKSVDDRLHEEIQNFIKAIGNVHKIEFFIRQLLKTEVFSHFSWIFCIILQIMLGKGLKV